MFLSSNSETPCVYYTRFSFFLIWIFQRKEEIGMMERLNASFPKLSYTNGVSRKSARWHSLSNNEMLQNFRIRDVPIWAAQCPQFQNEQTYGTYARRRTEWRITMPNLIIQYSTVIDIRAVFVVHCHFKDSTGYNVVSNALIALAITKCYLC